MKAEKKLERIFKMIEMNSSIISSLKDSIKAIEKNDKSEFKDELSERKAVVFNMERMLNNFKWASCYRKLTQQPHQQSGTD